MPVRSIATRRLACARPTTKLDFIKPARLLVASLFFLPTTLLGQTTTQNYVLTNTVLVAGKSTAADVKSMANFNPSTGAVERQQQVTYVDGLGRPIQQVQVQASPSKLDMVVPIVYDFLGRTPTTYLPYTDGSTGPGNTGSFQPNALNQQSTFYQANGVLDHVVNDAVPSATNLFEASPLNRVLEQGAPGTAWQPGTHHTIKFAQRTNLANEVRQWTYDDTATPACTSPQFYAPGEVVVKETRDEQGGLVTDYVDKLGKLVLRKVSAASVVCETQVEASTLTLTAPAGMGFVGISSATYGHLLAGSNCDDAQFDLDHRVDVTTAVQDLVAGQLQMYPIPQTLSFTVDTNDLQADPYPGGPKTLLVEALYTSVKDPLNTDLQTCYIYDDLGNLRVVVQPQGYSGSYHPFNGVPGYTSTNTGPAILDDNTITTWGFRYTYDGRGRVISKQVPGGSTQLFVYNQRNQVVLSQDGNQASQGPPQWTFIKYDGLNRPVMTGKVTQPSETQASLQAILDAETILTETPDATSDVGYSLSNSYPRWTGWGHQPITADLLLTITYYDNYNFTRLANSQLAPSVSQRISRADGLVTGTSTRTVGPNGPTSQWLTMATYYDKNYRPLQVLALNQLGGVTTTTSTYDFVRLLSTSTTQSTTTNPLYSQTNRFTYGPANRLETTYQSTGNQTEIILSHQTYNEVGQLIAKRLHNDQPPVPPASPISVKYLQKVDYRYNIRGWLTHINNRDLDNNNIEDSPGVYVSDPEVTAADPDLFGLELRYDNMLHGGAQGQFNGNIAQAMWQTRSLNANTAQNNVLRFYNYHYDAVNRITAADFKEWDPIQQTSAPKPATSDYSVSGITYDRNGNLLTMTRNGAVNGDNTNPVMGVLDQLTYTYSWTNPNGSGQRVTGNRLLAVDDDAPRNTAPQDFEDNGSFKNNQVEYDYDANGNMTRDQNKGISSIQYSLLNQPTSIVFKSGDRIEYTYTATGTKLRKDVYTAGTLTGTTNYAGPLVYETRSGGSPTPVFAQTSEGRVLYLPATNGSLPWKYEYHLKDHLGNLRYAFRADKNNGIETQRTAGMEPVNASQEEQEFKHVADTRLLDPDHARTGAYVAHLSARSGQREGPSLRLPVHPGDSVRAEVYARYDRNTGTASVWQKGAMVLGSTTMDTPSQPSPEQPQSTARRRRLPFFGASLAIVPQLFGQRTVLPVAYLRYEVFNKDSQLVATQTQPVQRTATDEWQRLLTGTRIDSTGFVQVSLVNESGEAAYFDDLRVSAVAPSPYQENHYDPFGLNLVGIEVADIPNSQYQYNGKEKQEDFGLNWTDYGARMYDMQLGRWNAIDPMSNFNVEHSIYSYANNDPINNIDIEGDFRLSIELQRKYPYLTSLLEHVTEKIADNPFALNTISSYTGYSKDEIIKNATWNSGPEIIEFDPNHHVNESSASDKLSGDYGYSNDNIPGRPLHINIILLKRLELYAKKDFIQSSSGLSSKQLYEFMTLITVFHEFIHYGRTTNNMGTKVGAGGFDKEAGKNWEIATFGFISNVENVQNEVTKRRNEFNQALGHGSPSTIPWQGFLSSDFNYPNAPKKKHVKNPRFR